MRSRTPGLPLMRVNERKSSVASFTSAMSLQVDRDARARHDDEVADLVEVLELPLAANEIRAVPFVDLAERDVLVLGAQQVGDPIDRQVERRDLLFRQLDVDLAAQAAFDGHRRDARARARDAATDRARRSRGGARRSKSPSTPTPMMGKVFASNLNMTGASASSGSRPRTRSSRLRTSSAASLRSVPQAKFSVTRLEPSDDVDSSRSRPGDRAHRLFERPRDELFHLERPDAGVADADGDARERDVRHQVDRQPRERQPADEDDHARQHEHRDRPLNRNTRNAHRPPPLRGRRPRRRVAAAACRRP